MKLCMFIGFCCIMCGQIEALEAVWKWRVK